MKFYNNLSLLHIWVYVHRSVKLLATAGDTEAFTASAQFFWIIFSFEDIAGNFPTFSFGFKKKLKSSPRNSGVFKYFVC